MPERSQDERPTRRAAVDQSTRNETAASIAEKTRQAAREVSDKAGEAVQDVTSAASDKTQELAEDAVASVKSTTKDVAEHGKDWTRDAVRSIGRAIDAGGESLERDGMSATAGYVRAAANGLMQAADSVEDVNTTRLTNRAESFVRERPMMSIAALALVGFAVTSVLRKDRS